MLVRDFEQTVFNCEGIRIVIQASRNQEVDTFGYVRASKSITIRQWLNRRIVPRIRGFKVSVLDGEGRAVPLQTKLDTLRGRYQIPTPAKSEGGDVSQPSRDDVAVPGEEG